MGGTEEGFWQTETIRGGSGEANRRQGAGLYPKYRACSTLGSLSTKPTRLSREDRMPTATQEPPWRLPVEENST